MSAANAPQIDQDKLNELKQKQAARKEVLDKKMVTNTIIENNNATREKNISNRLTRVNKELEKSPKDKDLLAQKAQIKSDLDALAEKKAALYEQKLKTHAAAKKVKHLDKVMGEAANEYYDEKIEAQKQNIEETQAELDALETEAETINPEENPEAAAQNQQAQESKEDELEAEEEELAQTEAEAEQASDEAAEHSTENADRVAQSCPKKCEVTKLGVTTNNGQRGVSLELTSGQKTIKVISQSKKATDRGLREPGVRVIHASLEGACKKGKTSVSTESSQAAKHVRQGFDKHCPVMTIKKDETDLAMPGNSGSPLKFNAYCPDPPGELFTIKDWGYLIKHVFLEDKRESKDYIIEAKSCDASAPFSAKVQAYPKVEASLGISLTYNYQKKKDLVNYQDHPGDPMVEKIESDPSKGVKTVHIDKWEIGAELKGKVDQVDLAAQIQYLEPSEILKELRQSISLFILFFEVIDSCTKNEIGANMVDAIYGGKQVIGKEGTNDDLLKAQTAGKGMDTSRSGSTGTISIRYPKLALNLKMENTETKQNTELDHAWTASLQAAPLIGVQMKVDILSALIKIGANCLLPGSSAAFEAGKKFVNFIWPIIEKAMEKLDSKDKFEKNIEDRKFYLEAGIALHMTVGAELGCALQWKKDYGEPDASIPPPNPDEQESAVSGGASASMDFILEGKVYAKGKVFVVEFEAGLMVAVGAAKETGAAKLEFKLEALLKGGKPAVKGAVEWNGLALLFAAYKTIGIKTEQNDEAKNSNDDDLFGEVVETATPDSTTSKEELYKNQWVLIEPGKYPKDPEVPLDQYAKF